LKTARLFAAAYTVRRPPAPSGGTLSHAVRHQQQQPGLVGENPEDFFATNVVGIFVFSDAQPQQHRRHGRNVEPRHALRRRRLQLRGVDQPTAGAVSSARQKDVERQRPCRAVSTDFGPGDGILGLAQGEPRQQRINKRRYDRRPVRPVFTRRARIFPSVRTSDGHHDDPRRCLAAPAGYDQTGRSVGGSMTPAVRRGVRHRHGNTAGKIPSIPGSFTARRPAQDDRDRFPPNESQRYKLRVGRQTAPGQIAGDGYTSHRQPTRAYRVPASSTNPGQSSASLSGYDASSSFGINNAGDVRPATVEPPITSPTGTPNHCFPLQRRARSATSTPAR